MTELTIGGAPNGHAIAVLHDASPAFSMRNIGVGRYAA